MMLLLHRHCSSLPISFRHTASMVEPTRHHRTEVPPIHLIRPAGGSNPVAWNVFDVVVVTSVRRTARAVLCILPRRVAAPFNYYGEARRLLCSPLCRPMALHHPSRLHCSSCANPWPGIGCPSTPAGARKTPSMTDKNTQADTNGSARGRFQDRKHTNRSNYAGCGVIDFVPHVQPEPSMVSALPIGYPFHWSPSYTTRLILAAIGNKNCPVKTCIVSRSSTSSTLMTEVEICQHLDEAEDR